MKHSTLLKRAFALLIACTIMGSATKAEGFVIIDRGDPECPPLLCEGNPTDTICLDGNLGLSGTLFVNKIDPVLFDVYGNCDEDPYGTICFSGDVAIQKGKKLFVDFICAVTFDEYGNCIEDPDGMVTICNLNIPDPQVPPSLECIDRLSMKECGLLLTNHIDPVIENDPYCNLDPYGITCFSGNVGINECKKLLVNFIDPVQNFSNGCEGTINCKEKDGGITCFSGDVGIDKRRKLLVNWIDPVDEKQIVCPSSPTGYVTVCKESDHPNACTAFSGNVAITAGKKLLVNEIDPIAPACDPFCVPDETGITCFSGNVGLNECRILFANQINPAKHDHYGKCMNEADDNGVTCFSGNVGINFEKELLVNKLTPVQSKDIGCKEDGCERDTTGTICVCGDFGIVDGKKLLVNEICAVMDDGNGGCKEDPNGKVKICNIDLPPPSLECIKDFSMDPCSKILTNFINPVQKLNEYCTPYDVGTTCFSGNVGIHEDKRLLVNEINPVRSEWDSSCSEYLCNVYDDGQTCFSGNVRFKKDSCFDGQVTIKDGFCVNNRAKFNRELCVYGNAQFKDDVCIDECNTLFVNKIDPKMGDTTCFSGNVGINTGKKLLVNEINPVHMVWDPYCTEYVCDEYDDGTTCFSGDVRFKKDTCFEGETRLKDDVCINGAVKIEQELCVYGNAQFKDDVCIDECNTLFVNKIDPKTGDTTCFSGHVGIDEGKRLLVNEINPVHKVWDPYCTEYVCDVYDDGQTCFSGDVRFKKDTCFDGQVTIKDGFCVNNRALFKQELCVYGNAQFKEDVCIDPCNTLFVNKIDPKTGDITCFSGDIGVDKCKRLLVNHIDPVQDKLLNCPPEDVYGCEVDPTGTTCFSGHVGIDPCKKLLVNKICPVQQTYGACEEKACGEDPDGCIELCGKKVIIPGTLLANKLVPFKPNKSIKIEGKLSIDADLELKGSLLVPTDDRIKKNVRVIAPEDSLEMISSLIAEKYSLTDQWKKNTRSSASTSLGFATDAIVETAPDLVRVMPYRDDLGFDNFFAIDYKNLAVHLVGALQAQQHELEELKDRMERYEK